MAGVYAAFAAGKPHDEKEEALIEDDIIAMYYIGQMVLSKGYIPKIEETHSKQSFVNFANDKKNKIFYYSGHGGGDATETWLSPGIDETVNPSRRDLEYSVSPSDINTDARIVFLNSCSSASTRDFATSFGINNDFPPKVFLGFSNTVVFWETASAFAYAWWKLMYEGKTAAEAVGKIPDELKEFDEIDVFNNGGRAEIVIIGDPNTIL